MCTGDDEVMLAGARRRGIVRIGDTVRRPPGHASERAESLLLHLEAVGFGGAPRFLGRDAAGREILSYLPGRVARHRPPVGLARLRSAGSLIRRFHDATAGTALAAPEEVVCHGELGPHNTLFRGSEAVALIDFDTLYAGTRADDLGHAAWFFVPIAEEGASSGEQRERLAAFCASYGCAPAAVLEALAARFARAEAWYRERELERGVTIFHDYSMRLTASRAALLGRA